MITFHVSCGTERQYQGDSFQLQGDRIEVIQDGARQIAADCPDDYWVDAESGSVQRAVWTNNGNHVHVFIDDKHISKGRSPRLIVVGEESFLRVNGRDVAKFTDGSWWRLRKNGARYTPIRRIVIGPKNTPAIDEPWHQVVAASPRHRRSALAESALRQVTAPVFSVPEEATPAQ